jgi:hypothetical protein
MTSPTTTKSFTAGHFELQIDGHKTTTFLRNVSGGWVKAGVIDDPMGTSSHRIKHLGPVEVDPMQVEFGLAGSAPILKWIQGSWSRTWARRNGQITHADFNLKQTFEHWFYDALLLEATFPTLDANSREPAFLKCKWQAENVRTLSTPNSNTQLQSQTPPDQKRWVPSAFRLRIDQFDGMEYTSKIDSLTIKQGVKKMHTGKDRLPQIEPTGLQFPNVVGYISLAHASRLLQWHDEYVVKGDKDPRAQLSGTIEFLTPDRKNSIFNINLFEAGLMYAQIEDATANAEQIKRVKFELFVGRMSLDGADTLALA